VNRTTLYEMVQRGEIPGVVHIGRTIRFQRRVVEWMCSKAASALNEESHMT